MDRHTGAPLSGLAHIRQSVEDILSTPIGTRVMRRDYGSHVPELMDQPLSAATRIRFFAAIALALLRWEPRVRLKKVAIPTFGVRDLDGVVLGRDPQALARGQLQIELTLELQGAPAPRDLSVTLPLRGQFVALQPAFAFA